MPLEVPRDRDGTLEPQIVQKGQTRFDGFDDKILSLYSRGITTREIQESGLQPESIRISGGCDMRGDLSGPSARTKMSLERGGSKV